MGLEGKILGRAPGVLGVAMTNNILNIHLNQFISLSQTITEYALWGGRRISGMSSCSSFCCEKFDVEESATKACIPYAQKSNNGWYAVRYWLLSSCLSSGT